MKILIDARMYGLENTGIGRYLIELINNLCTIKSDVQFVIFLRKKYFQSLTLPSNWKKVLVDIPHYTLSEQIILPFFLARYKADLVHFPHLNVPFMFRSRFVVTVHDLTMQKQGYGATKLPLPVYLLKRIPFLLIAKRAVKDAVKILVPSKSTATDVANFYDVLIKNIVVTYEGFGLEFLSGTRQVGEISKLSKYNLVGKDYFFYIGNAYPHKNLEIVVRAVKDLNEKKKTNVLFVIAGLKNSFVEKLEIYVNDIGASKYIKLIGYVNDEDLPVLYKNSLGFVYPSLSEGFGLQGLEAIVAGTTLACSNIPVFKEIYEFHAFYFDPKDVVSVSSTLFSICNMKKEDKHKYIRSAQKFIEKYSWKKMAEETMEVYKSV